MSFIRKLFSKSEEPAIKVYRASDGAIIPYRTTDGAAGYDMILDMSADDELKDHENYSTVSEIIDNLNLYGYHKFATGIYIMPHQTVKLHTGICMEIPKGYCGLLMNRSSLSNIDRLVLCDNVGLIDSDYRGEITLHILNESDEIAKINNHTRICQLVIIPHLSDKMVDAEKLSDTYRGKRGYGSTGNSIYDD